MAVDAGYKRKRVERLEERFEFQGDAIAVSPDQALPSALFRVVERRTGAERALRLWRKTGTTADRDLRQLWQHESRQVRRLMVTAGAPELVVNVLEFVEDEQEFGVVLEDAGMPLPRLRERADRNHWIRGLAVPANRIVLWRNVARMAQALDLLHGQGMIHGRLLSHAIMTYGDRVPDFKLTGFEWSLWFTAPGSQDGHPPVARYGPAGPGAYSFATDWLRLGEITSDLLGVTRQQDGLFLSPEGGVELLPSEHSLLRRLVSPVRTEALDASGVLSVIDGVTAELEKSGAVRSGMLVLVVPDTAGLDGAVSRATGGEVDVADHAACIEWAQADLSGGATLVVPAIGVSDKPAFLTTQTMRYELRQSQAHGREPTWQSAYASRARLREDAGAPIWPVEARSVILPIEVIGIPRLARERLDRLGPAALDWETLLRPVKPPVADGREDVRHALTLVQAVEAVVRSLATLPVEVIGSSRMAGGLRLIVRAKPDNDRDPMARALGLAITEEALRRTFIEEQREGEENWALSPNPSIGGSRSADDQVTFIKEVRHQGLLGYEFSVDGEPERGRPMFLRPRQDSGTRRVIASRLRIIRTLAEQPGLADFLADPWSARRTVASDLDKDAAFFALDEAKQKALCRFATTAPAHFVVGPPGVGKTRLATEVVRRKLASGSTRLFLTSQGHDALDNLEVEVRKVAGGPSPEAPIIVRAVSEARPKQAIETRWQVAGVLARMAASPGLARLPPSFRDRAAELAGAAQGAAAGGGGADKARAGIRSTADLVLDAADIVLATTNSSYVERLLEERASFDAVIVEEAAKATGPELVGPLLLSGRRLLIGDHNQLPPFDTATFERVLGSHALTELILRDVDKLAGGLFPGGELEGLRDLAKDENRMERVRGLALRLVQFFKTIAEGDEVRAAAGPHQRRLTSMLDEQRRMHPAIAEVVSKTFYRGLLRTADDKEADAYSIPPPFECLGPMPSSPVVVADFEHVMLTGTAKPMEGQGRRWTNPDEADTVLAALRHVRVTGNGAPPTLAILSPYAAQVELLGRKVNAARHRGALAALERFAPARPGLDFVGTVDSFQGAEADLVVVSLVRNNPRAGFGALGFLRSAQRMNVLLSRAKSKVILITSLRFLDEAVGGATAEQRMQLAFIQRLLGCVEDLSGRTGPDGVPLAAVVRASDLGTVP